MLKTINAPLIVWFLRAGISLMFLWVVLVGQKQALPAHEQGPWVKPQQQHAENGIPAESEPGDVISPFLLTAFPSFPSGDASAKADEGQNERGQPKEEGTEFWPPLLGYRLKVTDTLVALFTFLLFVATVFLWKATRNLVFDAKGTSERQLRAYVFDSAGGITATCTAFQPSGYCNILVEVKNYGNTPAYKFDIIISAAIFSEEPNEFPDQADQREGRFNILAPQYARDINKIIDITVDEARDIRSGNKRIFVWGEMSYTDAFGHARWFKFYRKSGNLIPSETFKWNLMSADKADETDED